MNIIPKKILFVFPLFLFFAMSSEAQEVHFQTTVVNQFHGGFAAAYSGQNSFVSQSESLTSLTSTLFVDFKACSGGEIFVSPELAGGSGLSQTKGVAGFPNGEIYRVDDPQPKFNWSRIYVRQSVGDWKIVLGKFSLNDFFDANTYSHDPRTQFLNWSLMDNGAWDYAADTRGYTWGTEVEYGQAAWTLRFAAVAVPQKANGIDLDMNLSQAHGLNLEREDRYSWGARPGVLRLLAFANQAHMGSYRETLDTPSFGMDISQSRQYRTKYGFGVNIEQELADGVGCFSRLGWNDGRSESWAFTEVDRSVSVGVQWSAWGLALIANGLSDDHAAYLAAGGNGFILGDGGLNYGWEQIVESYYRFHVFSGFDISPDVQFIQNPGYNRDRGPVLVFAIRGHSEL
jgi:high affinity Mn2+ porin